MKLLEEIQAMRTEPGELMICWLGQAGACLKDAEGRIVYVDPYFTNCGERMRGFKRLSPQLIDPTEVTAAYYITPTLITSILTGFLRWQPITRR